MMNASGVPVNLEPKRGRSERVRRLYREWLSNYGGFVYVGSRRRKGVSDGGFLLILVAVLLIELQVAF
jgi:hypothetical protein